MTPIEALYKIRDESSYCKTCKAFPPTWYRAGSEYCSVCSSEIHDAGTLDFIEEYLREYEKNV